MAKLTISLDDGSGKAINVSDGTPLPLPDQSGWIRISGLDEEYAIHGTRIRSMHLVHGANT